MQIGLWLYRDMIGYLKRAQIQKRVSITQGRTRISIMTSSVWNFAGSDSNIFQAEEKCRARISTGAFHSTKNSGLNCRNFRVPNGTVFSNTPDQSRSIPAWAVPPPQYLLDKMLKDNDELAVSCTVSCVEIWHAFTIKDTLPRYQPDRLKNYFRVIRNLRTFLAGHYANRTSTHRKYGAISLQFSRKADPNVFAEARAVGNRFVLSTGRHLVALVEAIFAAGGTNANSYRVLNGTGSFHNFQISKKPGQPRVVDQSLNLLAFYHECILLIGLTTHLLFCDR